MARRLPPLTEWQVRSMAMLACGYVVLATPDTRRWRSLVKRGLAVEPQPGCFEASIGLLERLRHVGEV